MDPTPDPPPSAAPLRLPLDAASERAHATLRMAAAFIALGAGIWLVSVDGRFWLRLTALASVAFALRWLQLLRAARAALSDGAGQYLEIASDQVVLAAGASVRRVPRDSIRAVELDHDRLVVVLRLTSGEELPIEPRYGGLDLRELGETLQRALWEPAHRDAPR
jgi:hypothetical protein